MSDRYYHRNLMRSMFLKVIVVSLTPLLIISLVAAVEFHTAYRAKVMAHLEELVKKQQQSINGFLAVRTAEIKMLARAFSLERLSDEDDLSELLQILQEQYEGVFVDLGLVNGEGVQVAYAGPFRLAKVRYTDAPWFREAIGRNVYISDVFLGLRGLPHFIVAVKRTLDGQDWILRSTIDFVAFNRLVENVRLGETGLAFIINRQGEFQTKPRIDLSREVPAILEQVGQFKPEGAQSLPGGGLISVINERQPQVQVFIRRASEEVEECIYVTTHLKGGEWILVFRQEVGDAFFNLYRARNIDIAVVLIGSLAIILMAWFLSKRTVNRIAQADEEKEMVNEQFIEAGKLASVGELAAGIAHEINNPVAIMVEEAGWVEDLMDEDGCEINERDEIGRALKQIRTQGARCKEITHKLLSFARRTDPSVRVLSVNDLANEILSITEQRARLANISVERDLSSDVPPIAASPAEMQQVLLNLVNNAIDAMEARGGVLRVSTRLQDGVVLLEVTDTGHGIPKANLQRIFDPFFTTKPVGKGTGLGLSICYGIIRKLDGEISVSSTVGQGTTFHIHIPVPAAGDVEAKRTGVEDATEVHCPEERNTTREETT